MSAIVWTPRARLVGRVLGAVAGLVALATLGGLFGAIFYLNFIDTAIERGAL